MNCVVIPAFRCADHIAAVVSGIGPDVDRILVIDDACPDGSGKRVEETIGDPRVRVIYHAENLGVGGAVKTGMREALAEGATIIVKIDGDGQMDPGLIPRFLRPIRDGRADYAKGNRFYNLSDLTEMPLVRLLGNAGLSLFSKASSGYWSVMDPTNGYIAIHASLVRLLPLDKISDRFFFESDMLFRLATFRARVFEVSMPARYRDEASSLSPTVSLFRFSASHCKRFVKRFFYNYVLRDFNVATLASVFGVIALLFGVAFGANRWLLSIESGVAATTGTVMVALLPVVLGAQLLLFAMQYDVANEPKDAIHPYL
ncbi:MAG: glycosyltransferase family 2 protein [Pseudomonadota bacterium]